MQSEFVKRLNQQKADDEDFLNLLQMPNDEEVNEEMILDNRPPPNIPSKSVDDEDI